MNTLEIRLLHNVVKLFTQMVAVTQYPYDYLVAIAKTLIPTSHF